MRTSLPQLFRGILREDVRPDEGFQRCAAAAVATSVQRLRVCDGHRVQNLVQQLQRSVQMDLDPAGGLLDALAGVVGSPALDKTHPEDAQPTEVVNADARRC